MNLTPTEREVLRMLCEGMKAVEVAEARGQWISNINLHTTNMRRKNNARTTYQLIYMAAKEGIFDA